MIFTGSRYTRTAVITPPNAAGDTPRVLDLRVLASPPGQVTYVVVGGDRLDQLAYRFYGDPKKYWLILDANPDVISPFELLQPGQPIQIPKNRIVT